MNAYQKQRTYEARVLTLVNSKISKHGFGGKRYPNWRTHSQILKNRKTPFPFSIAEATLQGASAYLGSTSSYSLRISKKRQSANLRGVQALESLLQREIKTRPTIDQLADFIVAATDQHLNDIPPVEKQDDTKKVITVEEQSVVHNESWADLAGDNESWEDLADDEDEPMKDPEDLEQCLEDFMLSPELREMARELAELETDNANLTQFECQPSSHHTDDQLQGAYQFFMDQYRDAQIGPGDYSTLHFPRKDSEFVSLTVGKQGCNLKRITEESGLRYMWYNSDGFYQLWGEPQQMLVAKGLLDRQATWAHQLIESR